jgi:hypothetical protein
VKNASASNKANTNHDNPEKLIICFKIMDAQKKVEKGKNQCCEAASV